MVTQFLGHRRHLCCSHGMGHHSQNRSVYLSSRLFRFLNNILALFWPFFTLNRFCFGRFFSTEPGEDALQQLENIPDCLRSSIDVFCLWSLVHAGESSFSSRGLFYFFLSLINHFMMLLRFQSSFNVIYQSRNYALFTGMTTK